MANDGDDYEMNIREENDELHDAFRTKVEQLQSEETGEIDPKQAEWWKFMRVFTCSVWSSLNHAQTA